MVGVFGFNEKLSSCNGDADPVAEDASPERPESPFFFNIGNPPKSSDETSVTSDLDETPDFFNTGNPPKSCSSKLSIILFI